MQYIVPIMSDGMLELSNVLPEDPIEFMVILQITIYLLFFSQNISIEEVLKLEKKDQIMFLDFIRFKINFRFLRFLYFYKLQKF